jgi:hypothetical protein
MLQHTRLEGGSVCCLSGGVSHSVTVPTQTVHPVCVCVCVCVCLWGGGIRDGGGVCLCKGGGSHLVLHAVPFVRSRPSSAHPPPPHADVLGGVWLVSSRECHIPLLPSPPPSSSLQGEVEADSLVDDREHHQPTYPAEVLLLLLPPLLLLLV